MSNKSSSSSGIGCTGLLTIVFIILKLIGEIDWSWWWVLAPVWGMAAFVLILLFTGILLALAHENR